MYKITFPKDKQVFFLSDSHLGVPDFQASKTREKEMVRWLQSIKHKAAAIFLLGDLFDFWFEYKKVIPKGFTRLLGKLCELTDQKITIYFVCGNHDMWLRNYFTDEIGLLVLKKPETFLINNKKFFIGHGDGLGAADNGHKLLKKIFSNKWLITLFRQLHPDMALRLGQYLSKQKKISSEKSATFKGKHQEWLTQFCLDKLKKEHYDYFVFGHRHLPLEIQLNKNSAYINLGEWISQFTYAVFDKDKITLNQWQTINNDTKANIIRC